MTRGLERPPTWAWVAMAVSVIAILAMMPLAMATPKSPSFTAPPAPVVAPPPEPLSVAFLGDSYAAGTGTENATKSFAQVAARELGWAPVSVFAVGGTGYSGPTAEADYLSRVDEVVAAQPDIVVVNGTRNDAGMGRERIREKAAAVYAAIRAGLPDARLLVIGPIWTSDDAPAAMDVLNEGVRLAAEDAGAVFFDALHPSWLPGEPGQVADDVVHPTEAGHQVIAAAFVAAVKATAPDLVVTP